MPEELESLLAKLPGDGVDTLHEKVKEQTDDAKSFELILRYAIENNATEKFFQAAFALNFTLSRATKAELLELTVQHKNKAAIQPLIDAKGDRIYDADKYPAIMVAAASGTTDLLQLLIDSVSEWDSSWYNPREKDQEGNTPLHAAVAGGHLEAVEMLLKQRVVNTGVNLRNNAGLSAIYLAALHEKREIFNTLKKHSKLNRKWRITLRNQSGSDNNPHAFIRYLCDSSLPKEQLQRVITFLTSEGVHFKGTYQRTIRAALDSPLKCTPMGWAIWKGNCDVVRCLKESGVELDSMLMSCFHNKYYTGFLAIALIEDDDKFVGPNKEMVKCLLELGVQPTEEQLENSVVKEVVAEIQGEQKKSKGTESAQV